MKKYFLSFALILLVLAMVTGCGKAADADVPATEVPVAENTTPATEAPAEEAATEAPAENDQATYYIEEVYAEQIGRYYTALSEKWEESEYFDQGLSAQPYYYYEGNPLENVGFGFVDLDNDGSWELVIGAIQNAEQDPSVFEVWTLVDGKPVMLAQGGSRNRYVLQHVEEDEMWYVVNEGSNSAFSHATYCLMLSEGKFEVVQGIVFDAMADEQNPWFMSYDLDWDVSNDEPIDEETANAVLEAICRHYTALEYFPYTYCE